MKATTAEIANATASELQSSCTEAVPRSCRNSKAVAANMVGMPTRNANSVAAGREVMPASMAANIVAADLEVPGNTAATIWLRPTQMATDQVASAAAPRSAS